MVYCLQTFKTRKIISHEIIERNISQHLNTSLFSFLLNTDKIVTGIEE